MLLHPFSFLCKWAGASEFKLSVLFLEMSIRREHRAKASVKEMCH